ncbi:MAG: hypothetical protein PVH11_02785 [Anaerolineae bacterium]|jgi:hypothetical protein
MARQVRYQIQIQGWIDGRWSSWFEGLQMCLELDGQGEPVTTLIAEVVDQAALRGILAKVWDLNLTVLSVTRCDGKGARGNESPRQTV